MIEPAGETEAAPEVSSGYANYVLVVLFVVELGRAPQAQALALEE